MKPGHFSPISGLIRTLDLKVTDEQIEAYRNGALPQEAFPNLNQIERNFVLAAITDNEWDHIFEDDIASS